MKDYRSKIFHFLFQTLIIRPVLFFLYKFRVEGVENLQQKEPTILVCKHQSWVDLFAICLASPKRLNYLAKKELLENLFGDFPGTILEKLGGLILPVSTTCLKWMGAIPVDREHPERILSSFKQMKFLLSRGESLVFFPEGRVIPDAVGEFKTGLIKMLIRMQEKMPKPLTFTPVGISYGRNPGRRKTLIVKIGAPLHFSRLDNDAAEVLKEKITSLTDFSL